MKRLFITYFLYATSLLVNAQFSGKGSGTVEDPYQISSPIHVDEIRNLAGIKDVCLVLTGNIEMADYIAENYGNAGWYPIPDFQGVLNGCGYSICGLWINRPNLNVGFFSSVNSAEIRNLTLEYINDISGLSAGALVCDATNSSITRCGIIAKNIISDNYTGGLVGTLNSGTIQECCCRFQEVESRENSAGGLVGIGNATIKNFLSIRDNRIAGNIVGQRSGGILGYMFSQVMCNIDNNLFEGNVTGDYAGGLFGNYNGYSHANVIIADVIGSTSNRYAYLSRVGYSDSNPELTDPRTNKAYMNTRLVAGGKEISYEENKYNGLNVGSSMLKQKSLYANMGWDMENVWNIDNSNSYPRLKWEIEDADGIVENQSSPIQVSIANGSLQIKNVPTNTKIKLYDLSGTLIYSVASTNSEIVISPPYINKYFIIKINNKSFKCKM